MKTIKVKSTGIVTTVSDEYFEAYQPGGWFIEVLPEVPKKVTKRVAKEDTKEDIKEE